MTGLSLSSFSGWRRGLTRNVVILGFVSFLNDAASEMIYPLLPVFLTAVLGAGPAVLGVIWRWASERSRRRCCSAWCGSGSALPMRSAWEPGSRSYPVCCWRH